MNIENDEGNAWIYYFNFNEAKKHTIRDVLDKNAIFPIIECKTYIRISPSSLTRSLGLSNRGVCVAICVAGHNTYIFDNIFAANEEQTEEQTKL